MTCSRPSAAVALFALLVGGAIPALAQEPRCFHPVMLGVNGDDAALARSAHLGWIRSTFRWSEIEPAPGAWDFRHTDAVVEGAEAAGVELLAILSTAPEWAGSNANGTRPPADVSLWRDFVRQVVSRYRGRVAAYEIWNEPNFFDQGLGVGWARDLGSPPRYVDYLRAAAEVIRAEAPGTLVVGPVTSSFPNARTVEVYAQLEETFGDGAPASGFLDAVSFHANAIDDEPAALVEGRVNQQLAIVAGRNPSSAGKAVWITETGWKTNRVGEGGQRGRVLSLLEAWSGRCDPRLPEKAFLFQLTDQPGTESRGLFRTDGAPKLIVPTYLATLPFPAATRDPLALHIAVVCEGLLCDLEATEWTGNPFSLAVCRWDLGDGTSEDGTSCRARHQYPDTRDRVVELTVEILGLVVHRADARVLPAGQCNDFDPPRVEITFPRPGADLTGTHSVLYFFRDNLGFSDTALLVDGRRVAGRPPPPFQLLFETGAFPTGRHQLQVALTDRCGNRTESAPVEVFIDRRPPTVEITAPAAGEVVSGRFIAVAAAADNRAIERVEMFLDRRRLATAREPPYELLWHAAYLTAGLHQISARAYDRAGNRGDAPPVTFRVDNSPPVLVLAAPRHEQVVSGSAVRLAGFALDATGVESLRFELDGAPLALSAPLAAVPRENACATYATLADPRCPAVGFRTAFDSTRLAEGPHTLRAIAIDGAGLETVVEMTVEVRNDLPPGSIVGLTSIAIPPCRSGLCRPARSSGRR